MKPSYLYSFIYSAAFAAAEFIPNFKFSLWSVAPGTPLDSLPVAVSSNNVFIAINSTGELGADFTEEGFFNLQSHESYLVLYDDRLTLCRHPLRCASPLTLKTFWGFKVDLQEPFFTPTKLGLLPTRLRLVRETVSPS